MIYLFVLGIPMMVVAALITFSDNALYTWYAAAPLIFSLDVLEDQRLGGVIMWVPGGLVIWLAITFVYFRWTNREKAIEEAEKEQQRTRVDRSRLVISPPPFPDR